MKRRLFLAADLPPVYRTHLLAAQRYVRQSARRASVTREENLHMTLRFIGDVEQTVSERIIDQFRVFPWPEGNRAQLRWVGFETFSSRDGHTFVARFHADDDLETLVRAWEQTLRQLGLPAERRRWKPHVTLARRVNWKTGADFDELEVTPGWRAIPDIRLYLSEFTPEGMRYTPLATKGFGRIG